MDDDMIDGCDLASITTGDTNIYTPTLSPLLSMPTQSSTFLSDSFFQSEVAMTHELPSSAVMDFTKTYDQGVFDNDLLLKMEETVDDLFHFS